MADVISKQEVITELQAEAQSNYLALSDEEKDTVRRFNGTEEARILRKIFPTLSEGLARLRAPEGVSMRRRGLATR